MNAAIMRKIARDWWWLLLLVPLVLIGFEVLFVRALGEMGLKTMSIVLNQDIARRFLRMMLGADLAIDFTPTSIVTFGMAHPFLYAVNWALLLAVCTSYTVAEAERGTADLLLTLPISRAAIFLSGSAVWMLAGVAVCLAPWGGLWLGQYFFPLWEPIDLRRFGLLSINLYALYLAVGCLTLLVSTLVDRRGAAIAIVLAGLLLSFLLNFLASLWRALEYVAAIGVLHYYKPLPVVRDGVFPWTNLAILMGIAAASWLVSFVVYKRRDVPAA